MAEAALHTCISRKHAASSYNKPQKSHILTACWLSLLITVVDAQAFNTGLPHIRDDLHPSAAMAQWMVEIYSLGLAALLLAGGAATDWLGPRRVFTSGLLIFALGSLCCSQAPSPSLIIAARLLEASGAAMLGPAAVSTIAQVFVDARDRVRAIGIWSSAVGVGVGVGPILGGEIVDSMGWRALVVIVLPLCAVTLLIVNRHVPASSLSSRRRPEGSIGQVFAACALAATVFVIIESPERSWLDPCVIVAIVVAVLALLAFVHIEQRHPRPMVELKWFGDVKFSGALLIIVSTYAAYGALLFILPLYLEVQRHYTAVHTGLMYLPLSLSIVVAPLISGRLASKFGNRPPLLLGGLALALASLALTQLSASTPPWALMCWLAIFGVGFGLTPTPSTSSVVGALPGFRSGAASAIAVTARYVGMSLGVALCGTFAGDALRHPNNDLVAATHTLWLVCCVFGGVIAVLSMLITSEIYLRPVITPAGCRSRWLATAFARGPKEST